MTNTSPEGTYSVRTNQNGRIVSVTQRDKNGALLGQTAFTYDDHGRQWKITDARNGTTTNGFNAADRMVSVSTPEPASGQGSQRTSYQFDAMGRVTATTHPDNAVLYNEYFLTGQLKNHYGTRAGWLSSAQH